MNSPIINTKLLREAYEAGRRQALNEQFNIPDMYGNPSSPGRGNPPRYNPPPAAPTDDRYRGKPGGGDIPIGDGNVYYGPNNTPVWWSRDPNPFENPRPGVKWNEDLGQWEFEDFKI